MATTLIIQATNTTAEHRATNGSSHPYYPIDSFIAGYAANEWSVFALLGAFFGACIALFLATYKVVQRIQPTLTRAEMLTVMWFVLSGSIHIFFEGYYVYHYATLGSKQSLIGQMWKVYAYSDSRYLTQNAFVLCVESITAVVWGPGCLLVAALVVQRSAWRAPLQMIVSMGQLYGDALYYATTFFDHHVLGVIYSRPEPFYFWFYFVLMNSFWIVIPGGE